MDHYDGIIHDAFTLGSVRDAETLFEACIAAAFPTFKFRRLELVRVVPEEEYMEGRSWNHVFEIRQALYKGAQVWAVHCHRVTLGKTPDKHVYLDYSTLEFVDYIPESL